VEWNIGLQGYGEEFLPITDFFNTHAWLRQFDFEPTFLPHFQLLRLHAHAGIHKNGYRFHYLRTEIPL
jgi:hypothetical protein